MKDHPTVVQFSSVAQSCPNLWDPMNCSTPGLSVHHQLPEFTQTHVHWDNDAIHLILCHTFLSHLQSFTASGSFQISQFFASGCLNIGVSASASALSNEYSGLISFRIDCFDLLADQVRVFSSTIIQKHQPQRSAFFMVQLSHPYRTTGKTIALTRWTFVCKVMSPLFNTLSGLS